MAGLINLFKPPGCSSRDAINMITQHLNASKAGHTGTLDPGATGVLLVLLGDATKTQKFFVGLDKSYVAEITFGIATDTADGFGKVTEIDSDPPTEPGHIENVLDQFRGKISQLPPMASAVKVGGRRLYELAREGKEVHRKSRDVQIKALELLDWRNTSPPRALMYIKCSSGTYIRTLAEDIAKKAGTYGYMSLLSRTSVGGFQLSESICIDDVANEAIIRMSEALTFLPSVVVIDETDLWHVSNGAAPKNVDLSHVQIGDTVKLTSPQEELLAIGEVNKSSNSEKIIFPKKVFPNPL